MIEKRNIDFVTIVHIVAIFKEAFRNCLKDILYRKKGWDYYEY